jgi:hypothetical protein
MGEAEGGKGEEAGRRDGGEEEDAGRARAHGSEGAGPLEQQVDVDQRTKTARGETTSRRPVDIFFFKLHIHTHTNTHDTYYSLFIIHCAGTVLFSIAAIVEFN